MASGWSISPAASLQQNLVVALMEGALGSPFGLVEKRGRGGSEMKEEERRGSCLVLGR